MMRPNGYKERLLDDKIKTLMSIFGAVQIDGPKWTGKTWTAKTHSVSEIDLDDDQVKPLVEADNSVALIGDRPHLIDEWQTIPRVRDAVRREVDRTGSQPGSFILTGSSAPPEDSYDHSGSGRIAHVDMRSMSLYELGLSSGKVSLQGLFEGEFSSSKTTATLGDFADWICRGGWPASAAMSLEQALYIPEQYIEAVCRNNARKANKDPELARRIIASLAKHNTTAAKIDTISSDLFAGASDKDQMPARNTTQSYIDFIQGLYMIENLGGWSAPIKSRARLRTKSKRYYTDPSLATAALGLNPSRLLKEGQLFGSLFENLCLRDLRVYASAFRGVSTPRLYYYRDDKGLEINVILELADGRWAAIEIKLGENKVPEGIKSLLALKKIATENPYSQQQEPSFLMVLIASGQFARKTPEGVYVVPLTTLGA